MPTDQDLKEKGITTKGGYPTRKGTGAAGRKKQNRINLSNT